MDIIQHYVETNQKDKVEQYRQTLQEKKQKKLLKYKDITFVQDDLMWQDMQENVSKKLNILELKIYCRKLELASKKDWRVPTYKELLRLIDYQKQQPAALGELENVRSEKYWSLSPNIQKADHFWYVDFQNGTTNYESKQIRNHIRCVRDISSKKGEI